MEGPSQTKVPLVIREGPICGFIEETKEGKYFQFLGIPYAKPPIGSLRFLAPVPIPEWKKEINCDKMPQPAFRHQDEGIFEGSEDCLYINVTTKNITPNKPLPVMFWFGAVYSFMGSLDGLLDPSLLVDEDVVYVSCGFRIGPFGFLSIMDMSAPGNAGLKDLVLALKWVQNNISVFGGDPNNVTLFGNGSSSALIHYMMLSPMGAGLFHKAIMQSSSALNSWALTKNPTKPVMELAKELGITASCKIEIVEILKTIPAEEIMSAFVKMEDTKFKAKENDLFNSMFRPCIEDEFEGQQAFLNKSPALILKSGRFNKVPIIIGSNNIEASLLQCIKDDFYNYETYNENTSLLVPKSLARVTNISKNIGLQLMKFYIGEEESLRADTKNQYLQLLSDYYFLYYINKTVRFHSQYAPHVPIYYYILNYAGDWSVPKELSFFNSMGHCGEIPYMFKIKLPDQPSCTGSRESLQVRKRVVTMWTNFAKYGNPTPDHEDPLLQITWDPVESRDRLNYLSIGSELTKGRNPFHERMMFWDKLHNEHVFLRAQVYFSDMGVEW